VLVFICGTCPAVLPVGLSIEEAVIVTEDTGPESQVTFGNEPDYGSGPYLALMARAVRLARLDVANPVYSAEARLFLRSDIVDLFAECLGYDGGFDA
jgi:hypothetical protein